MAKWIANWNADKHPEEAEPDEYRVLFAIRALVDAAELSFNTAHQHQTDHHATPSAIRPPIDDWSEEAVPHSHTNPGPRFYFPQASESHDLAVAREKLDMLRGVTVDVDLDLQAKRARPTRATATTHTAAPLDPFKALRDFADNL